MWNKVLVVGCIFKLCEASLPPDVLKDLTSPVRYLGEGCGYESCPAYRKSELLNVHIVPHSHGELGLTAFFDRHYTGEYPGIEKKLIKSMKNVLDATITHLWNNPTRRFTMSDLPYFFHWWSLRDGTVRRMVYTLLRQNRLSLVGGGWGMPDEATTNYQAVIDQHTYTLRKLNATFLECGRPIVAWQSDCAGHSREFASLYAQMGYDGFFLNPISHDDELTRMGQKALEFVWRGSDDLGRESDIYAHKLFDGFSCPPGFCFGTDQSDPLIVQSSGLFKNIDERAQQFIDDVRFRQAPNYRTNHIMVVMGGRFAYYDAERWFRNIERLMLRVNEMSVEQKLGVSVFYSTPACYLKAVHDSKPTLPVKQDDFFPHQEDPDTYATGLYTSMPAIKYMLVEGNIYMQMTKQIQVLAKLKWGSNDLRFEELHWILGVMQDHTVATGELGPEAYSNYNHRMYFAVQKATLIMKDGINKLRGCARTQMYYRCSFNESSCPPVNRFGAHIVVYNPLGWPVTLPIRLPVLKGSQVVIYNPKGEEVPSSLMKIPEPVLKIPERATVADDEVVFLAEDLPPLGYRSYYIARFYLRRLKRAILKKQDRISAALPPAPAAPASPASEEDTDYDDLKLNDKEAAQEKDALDIRKLLGDSKPVLKWDPELVPGFDSRPPQERQPSPPAAPQAKGLPVVEPPIVGPGPPEPNAGQFRRRGGQGMFSEGETISDLERAFDGPAADNQLQGLDPRVQGSDPGAKAGTGVPRLQGFGPRLQTGLGDPRMQGIDPRMQGIDPRMQGIDPGMQGIDSRMQGIDPRMQGLDPRMQGIDSRMQGIDPRMQGLDPRMQGIDPRMQGIDPRMQGLDPRMQGLDLGMQRLDPRVQGVDPRAQGIDPRVQGLDPRVQAGLDKKPFSDYSDYGDTKQDKYDKPGEGAEKPSAPFDDYYDDEEEAGNTTQAPGASVAISTVKPAEVARDEQPLVARDRPELPPPFESLNDTARKMFYEFASSRMNEAPLLNDTSTEAPSVPDPNAPLPKDVQEKLRELDLIKEKYKTEQIVTRKMLYNYEESPDDFIENKYVKIFVDRSTGHVKSMKLSSEQSIKLDIEFLYYESDDPVALGKNLIPPGPFVFRPLDVNPQRVGTKIDTKIYKTPVVQEIHMMFDTYASLALRLYKHRSVIEVDWLVGPLESDFIGKEIFLRYSTSLKSDGVFYTDANGRQTLKRIRDQRPMYVVRKPDPVAGNFYPVTSKIYIEDPYRKLRFAVFNDRSQGGSSLSDGQIDLMLHRKILTRDSISDAYLNETEYGQPIRVRGKHYIYLAPCDQKQFKVFEKKLAKEIALQPQVFAAHSLTEQSEWQAWKNEFTGIGTKLPFGVHLLTLQEWNDNALLIRVENYLERSDVAQEHWVRKVHLKYLFSTIIITSVKEMTLGGNRPYQEWTPLEWRRETEFVTSFNDQYGKTGEFQFKEDESLKPVSQADLIEGLTLEPQQIRTFVAKFTSRD